MPILLPDAGLDAGQDVLQDYEPASCHQDGNLGGLQKVCLQAVLQCCLACCPLLHLTEVCCSQETKALPLLTEQ